MRKLIEPGMEIVQRLAIALLALLDPSEEPPEQALDARLVHRAGAESEITAREAGLSIGF